jgi:hypothetical protein
MFQNFGGTISKENTQHKQIFDHQNNLIFKDSIQKISKKVHVIFESLKYDL